jgi:hypothetical protein
MQLEALVNDEIIKYKQRLFVKANLRFVLCKTNLIMYC